jgi:hypothetical protein
MLTAMLTRRGFTLSVGMIAIVAFAAAGCALARPGVDERTQQGPTAENMFKLRGVYTNGREPNFDERQQWDSRMEEAISAYLRGIPTGQRAQRLHFASCAR